MFRKFGLMVVLMLVAGIALARTDGDIETEIRRSFGSDPRIHSDSIDVSVINGNVTLSGTADSIAERDAAESVARNVEGVRSVTAAGVGFSAGSRPDTDILDSVKTALRSRATIDMTQVNIEVNGGNVVLSGTVGTMFERTEAERVTTDVRGVRSVRNNIIIVPRTEEPERTIPGTLP